MNKILQIKIYKILMGVMVFLCATYVFSLDVYAGYGMGFRDANGNDTNQISGTKVKIIANSWGNDTFKNAYIVYCSNVYEQNERLVKTYIEKYRSENTNK